MRPASLSQYHVVCCRFAVPWEATWLAELQSHPSATAELEPAEAGLAHQAPKHQHKYPRTGRDEQCRRRKSGYCFTGMDVGSPWGNHRELGGRQRILTTWINCPKQEVSQQIEKDPCWCLIWLWPFPGWASFLLWYPWSSWENPWWYSLYTPPTHHRHETSYLIILYLLLNNGSFTILFLKM